MFIDGRSLPKAQSLHADIAIVGAGAAGITLARALKDSGASVALIESGGFDYSETAQELASGELGDQPYGAPDAVRLRLFGGTTGHWGGWCRELDAIDFEARDFVPASGWPFAKGELTDHYAAAQSVLMLGPARYGDSEDMAQRSGARLPIARVGALEPVLFEFSPPVRMGEAYRDEIERSGIAAWLNTTVSDIGLDADRRTVTSLTLSRDGGEPLLMKVRHVVLACGALSNAQLLLNADREAAGGLGNGTDQVGRYFADHPILIGYAALLALDERAGGPFATDEIAAAPQRYRLAFQPSEDHRRKARRLSALITTEPAAATFDPAAGFDHFDPHWFGPRETAAAVATLATGAPARLHMLNAGIETRPNPDSRVTLTGQRDRFGMRRLKIDWKLSAADLDDYLANLADLARAYAATGTGVVRIAADAKERWPGETSWGNHNMGTTRMGADPASSVCDGDGRIHGIGNLWIAGSSLFTTCGAANPTLTIVALALRLAGRLKQELAA